MKSRLLTLKGRWRFPVCLIAGLLLTQNCSWLSKRKRLFETEEIQEKQKLAQRPKVERKLDPQKMQYDQLVDKYGNLKRKYDDKNMQGTEKALIKDLQSSGNSGKDLNNTVNAFDKSAPAVVLPTEEQKAVEIDLANPEKLNQELVEQEIKVLREGVRYLNQKKFDLAMKNFKLLETSKVNQIKVRAKYYIGEILFTQREYDLAKQVFEDIIQSYAFSGVVLKTLGRLVICTEKLNLKVKQDKYYSILHDFFGS